MKKIAYIALICAATLFEQSVNAQSLSDLFNAFSGLLGSSTEQTKEVEKPVYPTKKEIIGTWVYTQPEIVYEGEDALASLAISSVKEQLPALLQRYGFVAERDYAIIKDSKITAVSGEHKTKADYTYSPSDGKAVITGEYNGQQITVTGYVTIKDGKVTVLFDAQQLIAIASQSKQFKENTVLQMVASIISSYPGVKVGVTARKK